MEGLQTGVYPGQRTQGDNGLAVIAKNHEERRQEEIQALQEGIPGSRFETSLLTKEQAMKEFKEGATVQDIGFRWHTSHIVVGRLLKDDTEYQRLQALRMEFHQETARERHFSNDRYWVHEGKRMTAADLAKEAGCTPNAMWQRLHRRGLSPEEAVAAGPKSPQPGQHHLRGKRVTAAELAMLAGCSLSAMNGRLWQGKMTPEEAVAAGKKMSNAPLVPRRNR